LWSGSRARIASKDPPRFAGRTAWRALLPATQIAAEFREPLIHLWLGRNAHLVHYPIKGGKLINVVVITADDWSGPGWSEAASRIDLLAQLSDTRWAPNAHSLIRAPEAWLKWALYQAPPLANFGQGAAALLGDAAHAMLPFLAQGAAMAIEDAVVAAQCLARMPDNPAAAWETYSAVRRGRTRKVQRLAARNGTRYHLPGVAAMFRNTTMRLIGGERLLHHYDWLYDWRPPRALSIS
jgi:salicylate hydroxylase